MTLNPFARFRFSIRSLLLLTLCIAGGVTIYLQQRAQQTLAEANQKLVARVAEVERQWKLDRRAMAILRLQTSPNVDILVAGNVEVEFGSPPGKRSDAAVAGLVDIPDLTSVRFWYDVVDDRQLAQLAQHPSPAAVSIVHAPRVTAQGINALAAMPRLRQLRIAKLEPAVIQGVRWEAFAHLEWLALVGCELSDDVIPQIARCRSLRDLDLTGNSITTTGLTGLASLPKLRRLRLGDRKLTQGEFELLHQSPTLRALVIDRNLHPLEYMYGSPFRFELEEYGGYDGARRQWTAPLAPGP